MAKKKTSNMQWYRMDLHLHTPASADWQEPGVSYLDLLHLAEMQGLHIIAITDHNTVGGCAAIQADIEELGLGVDRMIEEMALAGHRPPDLKETPYSFAVGLSNVRDRPPTPRWERIMNERQAKALVYIRENGRITNREYRQICPGVSPETLRLDLADLVERGLLLKIGAKKGTYYILK